MPFKTMQMVIRHQKKGICLVKAHFKKCVYKRDLKEDKVCNLPDFLWSITPGWGGVGEVSGSSIWINWSLERLCFLKHENNCLDVINDWMAFFRFLGVKIIKNYQKRNHDFCSLSWYWWRWRQVWWDVSISGCIMMTLDLSVLRWRKLFTSLI